jgi:flagellin
MAKRNTQDAISMTQTAEGAMGVQVEQLQRVRELAVQASNGMLNATDRNKLENEADALIQELDKVATETNYNGNSLLAGEQDIVFQVGADNGDTRTVALVDTRSSVLGTKGTVTASSDGSNTFSATTDANFATMAAGSREHKSGTDFTTGNNIAMAVDGTFTGGDFSGYEVGDTGTITVYEDKGLATEIATDMQITVTNNDGVAGQFSVEYTDTAGTGDALSKMDISTAEGAMAAIEAVDNALDTVQTARSNMGTYQNRFEQVTDNLNSSIQNTSAARGRIQDTDFAKETADMTKNQILSQAGVSMLLKLTNYHKTYYLY